MKKMLIFKQHLRRITKRRKEEPCGEIEWMKKVLPVKKDDEDDHPYLQIHHQNTLVHGSSIDSTA